ncbi:MAG: hypothetical protein HRF50_05765 [Phycisphaerae bacterium]|jgi:regulator of protease activity HflC (stomatin/prohibitin superfamily)
MPRFPREPRDPTQPFPPLPRANRAVLGAAAALILVLLGACYWWFVQRVEVEAGQVLVLIRKVGQSLPAEYADQIVLYPELLQQLGEPPDSRRFKGVVYNVLTEGRYFIDPFFHERRIVPAVQIQQNQIGVLIRKCGKPLPAGKVVATAPDERGPLEQVLPPGRHNINPHVYEVRTFAPVQIRPGHVGVQTRYSGTEPANPNQYVVQDGERGVQPTVLPPGLYMNVNPYVVRIDPVDIQEQTLHLLNDDAIHFPSNDSFDIIIECTVVYAIREDRAPYTLVAFGDHPDVQTKLILPYMRSLARIEGSKLLAREFISGETRTAFQERVFEGLREACFDQGIAIRSVAIRRIEPPKDIANPISERQVAEQQIRQYDGEIKVAQAEARLVEQEEMQKQNQAIGSANRDVVRLVTEAEQHKAVALTEANKRLEVAKLNLQAANETAAALLERGKADAEVVRLNYEAEARPLRDAVAAFGSGELYAQYFFYQKLGPALKSVLATTEGPFADIFRSLSAPSEKPPPPRAGE